MPVTLEELEKRVVSLEQELVFLRRLLGGKDSAEMLAEGGARLLRQAEAGQAEFAAGWARAMEKLGIHGEPIGAEKLQQMIAACGVKPEDNEFSRGIIEMREE